MKHGRFNFRSAADLQKRAQDLGLDLPWSDDVGILFSTTAVAGRKVANRFVVLPMEGADAGARGAPSDLTMRRYRRYAAGGSGLIWFEATAVTPDARSNRHQLLLNAANRDAFRKLALATRQAAREAGGKEPLLVLQLAHAGRFAVKKTASSASDSALVRLQERFVAAARLAAEAGFDAVDVKACHGYLVGGLLAAFDRPGSRYGGTLQNRGRFLLETIVRIRSDIPELFVAVRLGAADFLPGGFGMEAGGLRENLLESKELIGWLQDRGVPLLGISLGIPRLNAHVGRPHDRPLPGKALPPEHPLAGVARHIRIAGELQKAFPALPMVGSGYSWLRQFFPHVAAGAIRSGAISLVGMGRLAFAYPDAPHDLGETGRFDAKKVCLTCSQCSLLLQRGGPAGCTVRDAGKYRVLS